MVDIDMYCKIVEYYSLTYFPLKMLKQICNITYELRMDIDLYMDIVFFFVQI